MATSTPMHTLSERREFDLDVRHIGSVGPLTLSLLAGLSTCLGATVVFWSKKRKLGPSHMAFALSLAGSVMITVSVASILPECFEIEGARVSYLGPSEWQFWARCFAFGVGCGLYILLSRCAFPEPEEILGLEAPQPVTTAGARRDNPSPSHILEGPRSTGRAPLHKVNKEETDDETHCTEYSISEEPSSRPLLSSSPARTAKQRKNLASVSSQPNLLVSVNSSEEDDCDKPGKGSEAKRAWRVTMLLFVSLAVHNFPEGLAVAASSLHSDKLGWTTTVAIALHNIPEGVAIAIPCMAARPDSPWLAFFLASLSGLAEPLGAAVAVFLLQGDQAGEGWLDQPDNMKNLLAFVAGVMIMVASIELYPEARRHMVESRWPGVSGTLLGVFIMLSSDAYLDS